MAVSPEFMSRRNVTPGESLTCGNGSPWENHFNGIGCAACEAESANRSEEDHGMAKRETKLRTAKVRPIADHGKVQHRPARAAKIVKDAKRIARSKKEADEDAQPSTPVDLGAILLPSPEQALAVLAELADLNDRALNAHAAYLERQQAAKKAKASWESLAEQVQDKLRLATHASGLPLFNEEERERDLSAMEASTADPVDEVDDQPPF